MGQKLLKCGKCGWVHFEVSRTYAEEQVAEFNKYFDSLSKEKQESYYNGNKSSIESYEKCFRCNTSHEQAVDAQDGDCPMGSTIQPMICPTDFGSIFKK